VQHFGEVVGDFEMLGGIFGKQLASFRCRTAFSGSSPRLSNPARHLREAAFLLEKGGVRDFV